MKEVRCKKCHKLFGKIFVPQIAIDRGFVPEQEEKRFEFKCPKCKYLNVWLMREFIKKETNLKIPEPPKFPEGEIVKSFI